MEKVRIVTFIFLISTLCSFAQLNRQKEATAIANFNGMPQESIYVHYNTGLLFSGEQLLYKIYCFNTESGKFSEISKIAYLELIAQDGTTVFKHKVRLNSGLGSGDFFVPANVPTGSYKLFAYTKWMQNEGVESFFEADMTIINPYQKTPNEYLVQTTDTVIENNALAPRSNEQLNANFNELLRLSTTKLDKRQKMEISIDNLDKTLIDGNYSLSIRRVGDLIADTPQNTISFYREYKGRSQENENYTQDFFIPELRGELLSGHLITKEDQTPVVGEKVALSLSGKNYLFKISTTDKEGRFYFNLNESYDNTTAVFHQLSGNFNENNVLFNEDRVNYKNLRFKPFQLDLSMKKKIEERSIQNQIENAYVGLKQDVNPVIEQKTPLYRKLRTIYDLDDYTRFNTLEETFVEIVDEVSIKKKSDGNHIFKISPPRDIGDSGLPPILFIDGIYVKEHKYFMNYSARKVKTIGFSKEIVFIGSNGFQGILSITTIDGDFYKSFYTDYQKEIELFEPQKKKIYFKQDYGTDSGKKWDRIPDFRRQLLWMPNIDFHSTELIELYTSDIEGDYKVVLEGFSSSGTPVSVTKVFHVE